MSIRPENSPASARGRKRYGFPKEARLGKKREFDAVFQEGAKAVGEALVIYARLNGMDRNRLGLVVGRKLGNAVRRNRMRRLLREAFRRESPALPQGYDLVCLPRRFGFPATAAELVPLFRALASKAIGRHKPRDRAEGKDQGLPPPRKGRVEKGRLP